MAGMDNRTFRIQPEFQRKDEGALGTQGTQKTPMFLVCCLHYERGTCLHSPPLALPKSSRLALRAVPLPACSGRDGSEHQRNAYAVSLAAEERVQRLEQHRHANTPGHGHSDSIHPALSPTRACTNLSPIAVCCAAAASAGACCSPLSVVALQKQQLCCSPLFVTHQGHGLHAQPFSQAANPLVPTPAQCPAPSPHLTPLAAV